MPEAVSRLLRRAAAQVALRNAGRLDWAAAHRLDRVVRQRPWIFVRPQESLQHLAAGDNPVSSERSLAPDAVAVDQLAAEPAAHRQGKETASVEDQGEGIRRQRFQMIQPQEEADGK